MYTSVRVYVLYCTYVIIYMQLTNCTELAYIENLSLNDIGDMRVLGHHEAKSFDEVPMYFLYDTKAELCLVNLASLDLCSIT